MNEREIRKTLRGLSPHGAVSPTDGFHSRLMGGLGRRFRRQFVLMKVLEAGSVLSLLIIVFLSVALLTGLGKPTRMVFVYPHDSQIRKVEVTGNFRHPVRKDTVPLKLNGDAGTWEAVVDLYHGNPVDYQIVVQQEEAGGLPNADSGKASPDEMDM